MLDRLPDEFDIGHVLETFPVQYNDSLNTVLKLECGTYNTLLQCIKKSLGKKLKILKYHF